MLTAERLIILALNLSIWDCRQHWILIEPKLVGYVLLGHSCQIRSLHDLVMLLFNHVELLLLLELPPVLLIPLLY